MWSLYTVQYTMYNLSAIILIFWVLYFYGRIWRSSLYCVCVVITKLPSWSMFFVHKFVVNINWYIFIIFDFFWCSKVFDSITQVFFSYHFLCSSSFLFYSKDCKYSLLYSRLRSFQGKQLFISFSILWLTDAPT